MPEDFDVNDIESYISKYDVKVAVLGEESYAVKLSDDEKYDLNLRLGIIDGKLTAVWENTDYGNMFAEDISSDDKFNRLYSAVFENGEWSIACLGSDAETVTDIEIAENKVAYIVDTDNNISGQINDGDTTKCVLNDKMIYSVTPADNGIISETELKNDYTDISSIGGKLVYTSNGSVYLLESNEKLTSCNNASIPEKYEVLTDAEGNVKGILFVSNTDNSSNLFGVFYDRDNDAWGQPIQLTDLCNDNYISEFGATDLENGQILLSVATNEVTKTQETVSVDGEETTFTDYENNITLEKALIIDCNFGYSLGTPKLNYIKVLPNTNVSVVIPIVNNSSYTLTADEIDISFRSASYE